MQDNLEIARGETPVRAHKPAPASPQFSHRALRGLLICLTIFLCLAMLEVGLRLIGRYQFGGTEGVLAKGGLSFVLKPNATKVVFWPTHSYTVYTCDHGFRYKKAGPRTIGERPYYATLGASDVFGNGLNYEQTFVGVLAQKMEPYNVEVVNMAVAGHHLLEQITVFKQYMADAKRAPDTVLIFLNPLIMGGYDEIHASTVVRWGELFPKDNWRMPLAKMVLANSSATYCFFKDALRKVQLNFFSRPDFSLGFYIERYSTKHPLRAPEKTAGFLQHMRELEQYIRNLKATPIVVYCPPVGGFLLNKLKDKGELDGSLFDTEFFLKLAQSHCETEGIRFINMEPMLQERYDRGEKLNFDLDAHFNAATSRAVGEYLFNELKPQTPPQP